MLATFPHLGPVSYVMSAFFNEIKIPYVIPPGNDTCTLKAGAEISPEEMCMPFKYMAGNLKRAYDMGADTAVMTATCGPCRLGEYCQLLMEVMENAGCRYRWVFLDSPADIGSRDFARRFSVLTEDSGVSGAKVMKTVTEGLAAVFKMDKLRNRLEWNAGFLENPYEAVDLMHETQKRLSEAESFVDCRYIIKEMSARLDGLKRKNNPAPVKILVTGEIYTSIDPAASGRLTEKLMMMGCSVRRHMSLSWWIRHTAAEVIVPEIIYDMFDVRGGIPCNIGGYGRQTVSGILRSSDYDGIIKIMPSGCMPEIVAKAFCEKDTRSSRVRMLHLVYDELSGSAGYQTRTEAFVDMLERRKNVLAGDRYRLDQY